MTATLPPELDFERLTVEEKYHRAVPGYMRRLCGIYEAMYERFGQESLDLIRQVSTEYGASIGRNVKKKGGLKGVAEVCKAQTCMEKTLVETLDEDLDYRIGRSIPKGDPYCEHILCRKADG